MEADRMPAPPPPTGLAGLARSVRIIATFWRATLVQAMEYRTSFLLSMVANAFDFLFGLLQYALFFTAAHTVAGWGINEMLAFYAVFMTVFSAHFIFLFPNLVDLAQLVHSGQLDHVLTKPISAQVFLSFRRLSFDECGSLLAAQALLAGLLLSGRLSLELWRVPAFLLGLACSFALVYSLFLFLMGLAIRLERLQGSAELLWSVFGLARYPVDVFPRWLKRLFYGVLPVAFITTVPARLLIAPAEPMVLVTAVALATTAGALATIYWRNSLAAYTSAGG
jgi:ABC-2 type transport system permease protein